MDREQLLLKMLNSRQKRIRILEKLIKAAREISIEGLTWGNHSELIDTRLKVRAVQDVVILLQEKNLLAELNGSSNYIKVGEIEREQDWPLRLRTKYGPLDAKDYYSKKLRTQVDEHNALLNNLTNDIKINDTIRVEMTKFVTGMFGHEAWYRMLEIRWHRIQQVKRQAGYDPKIDEMVPIVIKGHY